QLRARHRRARAEPARGLRRARAPARGARSDSPDGRCLAARRGAPRAPRGERVTRLLAGALIPAHANEEALARTLTRQVRSYPGLSLLERGALRVLCHGPAPPPSAVPLCLLEGSIDNVGAIAAELGRAQGGAPERVLAEAYERHGAALLGRLRGDFSLLIWDGVRERGLLARDQLGVRSLYLHERPGGVLCFATEICELLVLLPRRPAPDPAGVASWLSARPPPGASTLYGGIRRLAPAAVLRLSPERIEEERYWTPAYAGPQVDSAADSALRVREALAGAVARPMSPASTAVLMSGGLDSVSVAALAQRAARGGVLACSAFF